MTKSRRRESNPGFPAPAKPGVLTTRPRRELHFDFRRVTPLNFRKAREVWGSKIPIWKTVFLNLTYTYHNSGHFGPSGFGPGVPGITEVGGANAQDPCRSAPSEYFKHSLAGGQLLNRTT